MSSFWKKSQASRMWCCAALCAFRLASVAWAIPGYGPFLPTDRVRSVLLIEGSQKPDAGDDSGGSRWSVQVAERQWATIAVRTGGEGQAAELTLTPGGDAKPQTFKIPEAGAPMLITGVYAACLNADNAADFIVTRSYLGCGLAADITQLMFVLSQPDGKCSLEAHDTYDWGPEDIVDLGGDGKVRWVETQLEQTEDAKGRPQSFWVHALWRVEGGEVVREREVARRRYWREPSIAGASNR
jgi:hypothetical protein